MIKAAAFPWSGADTARVTLSSRRGPSVTSMLADMPMRSTLPFTCRRSEPSVSNNANLMLDEPPLMVRTRESAIFGACHNMDEGAGSYSRVSIRPDPLARFSEDAPNPAYGVWQGLAQAPCLHSRSGC